MSTIHEYRELFEPHAADDSFLSPNMHQRLQQLTTMVALGSIATLCATLFKLVPQRVQKFAFASTLLSHLVIRHLNQYHPTIANAGKALLEVVNAFELNWKNRPHSANLLELFLLRPTKNGCIFGLTSHEVKTESSQTTYTAEYAVLDLFISPMRRKYTFKSGQEIVRESSSDRVMIYRNPFTNQYHALFLSEGRYDNVSNQMLHHCGWTDGFATTRDYTELDKKKKLFVPSVKDHSSLSKLLVVNEDGSPFKLNKHHIETLFDEISARTSN